MATITDAAKNGQSEVVEMTQDAMRRYADESMALGKAYRRAWVNAAEAGLRMTFDLQNAALQASRALYDSAIQANRNWLDQAAASARRGQDAATKLMETGFDLAESALPNAKP